MPIANTPKPIQSKRMLFDGVVLGMKITSPTTAMMPNGRLT